MFEMAIRAARVKAFMGTAQAEVTDRSPWETSRPMAIPKKT